MSLYLLKSADKIPLEPIIAIVGPESYVRRRLRENIVVRALGSGLKDMNLNVFQAGEDAMDKIVDACRQYPCFTEKRAVVLRDISRIRKKESEELLAYLAAPSASTVFLVEDEKVDGRLDWVKALKKSAHWIEVSLCSDDEALAWIRDCFAREKKKPEAGVVERILDWVGASLEALEGTVAQLSLYVGDVPAVSLADIERLLVKVTEENVFEVVDQIFAGQIRECHASLQALLAGGEAPLKILALVYRHLAILLTLKEGSGSGSDLMRMPPMIRRKYEEQAKKYGARLHVGLIAPLTRADVQLKLSPLDKNLILKNTVEELMRLLGQGGNQLRKAGNFS